MKTYKYPCYQRTRLKPNRSGINSYYSTMLPTLTTTNVILYLALILLPSASADYVKNFKIRESVPIGTRIGYIGTPVPGQPRPPGPPYLVVPSADSPIAEDLDVDQNTGEIRDVNLIFLILFSSFLLHIAVSKKDIFQDL